jgi:hypothetical protein
MKNAEKTLSEFYKKFGWEIKDEITEDARQFEDLRNCASAYLTKCRMRVYEHIPKKGKYLLDMASGPIQYKEYLSYSKNFEKRYCVDMSVDALNLAKDKIGNHGEYINDSFFNINFQNNYFDCSISLHTIYHIDKDMQSIAVNKLLDATKLGHPVIIVYSNPDTLLNKLMILKNKLKNRKIKHNNFFKVTNEQEIYFYLHKLDWWDQFKDRATVKIHPWRSFLSDTQKKYFPNNKIGKLMFYILFKLENIFPNFFANNFQYVMIVLEKK